MDFNGPAGRRMVTRASDGTGRGPALRIAIRGAIALAVTAAGVAALSPSASAASRASVLRAAVPRPLAIRLGAARPGTVRPAVGSGMLTGVAATSATNAWAVGYGDGAALIEQWNGTSWTQQTTPAPRYSTLSAVAAASASSAWAVGTTNTDAPLILRWAGASWARVSLHLPSGSYLLAVTATSARNAWIVGSSGKSKWRTLILHWNGTSWKQVTSPSPKIARSVGDTLDAVTAVSAGDAWAAGWIADKSGNPARGLLLHWNGKTWRQVSAKAIPAKDGVLAGVAATSRSSAFAVGCDCTKNGSAVIDRWNGRSWAKAHLPARPAAASVEAVTASSARNAWAIGMYCPKTHCAEAQPLDSMLLHWNGKTWTRTAVPVPAADFLGGVAVVSASDAWAVGGSMSGSSVTLHWNGTAWSVSS
jgi:hypothetical protein